MILQMRTGFAVVGIGVGVGFGVGACCAFLLECCCKAMARAPPMITGSRSEGAFFDLRNRFNRVNLCFRPDSRVMSVLAVSYRELSCMHFLGVNLFGDLRRERKGNEDRFLKI